MFPQVIKAAFGIGGRGGRGVVVCRTANGWSAPAYLNIGGASFGFQIGAESTDYVMLFMTPESARSLLESNVKLGGSVSVAAGPIGREAEAATDLKLNAQILSYSRSKGLFAGAALEGAVIETADSDMKDVYGPNVTAKSVLFGGVNAPQEVTAFSKTIESFAPANGRSAFRRTSTQAGASPNVIPIARAVRMRSKSGGTRFCFPPTASSGTVTMSGGCEATITSNSPFSMHSTALPPNRVASVRSWLVGVPPRCRWPSTT